MGKIVAILILMQLNFKIFLKLMFQEHMIQIIILGNLKMILIFNKNRQISKIMKICLH